MDLNIPLSPLYSRKRVLLEGHLSTGSGFALLVSRLAGPFKNPFQQSAVTLVRKVYYLKRKFYLLSLSVVHLWKISLFL